MGRAARIKRLSNQLKRRERGHDLSPASNMTIAPAKIKQQMVVIARLPFAVPRRHGEYQSEKAVLMLCGGAHSQKRAEG
jgi:hypothetical protein